MKYPISKLQDITLIKTGKLDSNAAVPNGIYPFFTCDPNTLRINTWAYDTEAVLLAGNNASGNYTAKYYHGQFNAYQRTYIIESADKSILNVRYLQYAMNQQLKLLKTMSAGSTTKFLKMGMLHNLEIPFPPIEIQRRIASILSAYDDLIENNQKQIKLLEESAQRLYKEWFVDLRFPGWETAEIVDGVPVGWRVGKAEDFYQITIGKTPPRTEKQWFVSGEKGIPWLSISDMGNSGSFIFKTSEGLTEEAVKKHNMKVVPAGTVFVSFKLTVGRIAIATTEMCSNEAIAHFYVNDSQRAYAYCYLKNFEYDTLGNTSSISKAVNSKIIKAMPFIMPSAEILQAFSDQVEPILNEIKNKQATCIKLAEARDRLLPKLMSGELEV